MLAPLSMPSSFCMSFAGMRPSAYAVMPLLVVLATGMVMLSSVDWLAPNVFAADEPTVMVSVPLLADVIVPLVTVTAPFWLTEISMTAFPLPDSVIAPCQYPDKSIDTSPISSQSTVRVSSPVTSSVSSVITAIQDLYLSSPGAVLTFVR